MRFTKYASLLIITLTAIALHAQEPVAGAPPLDQAYLSHWFSYDSAEPIKFSLTPLNKDHLGERAELRFTSDDGQMVNGLIAYERASSITGNTSSKGEPSAAKLALLLHPMGIDQQFWWSDKSSLQANKITDRLRERGYTVISLDARRHGERGHDSFSPRELIARAHSSEPRLYIDTIIGSVRDYRIALHWAQRELSPEQIIVLGYSMGAQMSLLLASYEPSISAVVTMVPPYVSSPTSPVAPRIHAPRITAAKVLWLAGTNDTHSTQSQTQEAFDRISSKDKTLTWYDSGHRLPPKFLPTTFSFIDSLKKES